VLFEQLIVNTGHEIGWSSVDPDEWVAANVAAYEVDCTSLEDIFK
jgi:cell filamentation protein